MQIADRSEVPTAIRADLGAIFVSLELSRSTWLITSLSPRSGEKMSKHSVRGGDIAGLLKRFTQLQEKTRARTGKSFEIIVIQEAGLDGFWIHRVLQSKAIDSHIVDPVSIATSRRRRRAKTDRIDGEALVRALLAYKRGEPRVCAMVKVPTPEEEGRPARATVPSWVGAEWKRESVLGRTADTKPLHFPRLLTLALGVHRRFSPEIETGRLSLAASASRRTAPAWGQAEAANRTPDRGGRRFQSGAPCARHRQAQTSPSCLPVNRSSGVARSRTPKPPRSRPAWPIR